ncbi:MAG TPA: carboxypeptidase regulatory-like domain-containing protein [Bryobacteraceae bacterium]|nr:carboxypeptidase regulatory-like domain-containing protein [Bryobacteraceae bacterium]
MTVSFTSGQLNDVLKSLTVLDLDSGRITGVGYGSAAPVDRQLGDLRIPVDNKTSLVEFLGALRGARLEVRNGSAVIAGRLLSVERKTRVSGGTTLEVDYVSLITDAGELHTTEISPAISVRLLDHALAGKVERFLDLVSSEREPDVRKMVISTAGTGDRSLFVSYISETPVWKTTYRIVLNPKTGGKPLLQGWAIVDNTVGQDWEKVELSLVAGAPQSFIENLSQPYFSHRPVIALPGTVTTTPQTYEATLIPGGPRLVGTVRDPSGAVIPGATVRAFNASNTAVGEAISNSGGVYDMRGLPDGTLRLEINAQGFTKAVINGVTASTSGRRDVQLQVGSTTEAVEVSASSPGVRGGLGARTGHRNPIAAPRASMAPEALVAAARTGSVAAAQAQELGDLFEYKLKEPITIQKNRSALVPIVQSPIAAEKVSIWNEEAGLLKPQRALWLTNSSGLTLEGGSFSVLEEETFAGEGIFDPIRPNEKRLVSYATDLALNVSSKQGSEQERVTRVRINDGVMTQESEVREKKTYTFRNEDTSPRTVIVEHPVRSGYVLRNAVQPVETTAAWMRFRLEVGAKQTAELVVDEARPIEARYTLTDINGPLVATFVQQRSIDKSVEEALRKVLAQKAVIDDLTARSEARDGEMDKIFDDQKRLRENLKALKGSPEEKALVQRYTQQLNTQETRLETLRKEMEQIEAQKDKAQAGLDRMIGELSFDVKL